MPTQNANRLFVIEARGTQSYGVRVLDSSDWAAVAVFSTRAAARKYADEITPAQPSKYLPLVVATIGEAEMATVSPGGQPYRMVCDA